MSVASERRRYTRHQTKLPGRIGPPDGHQSQCLVRDYCSGGMLVQQAGKAPLAPQPGQLLQLKTELLTGKGSRAILIKATVAWISGDYLGLSFSSTSDVVVEALRHHDLLARSDASSTPDRESAGESRGLAKLRHVAQGALPALLRELLLNTGEDLLECAEKVSSNTEQQQIFGDMNTIEGLRQGDSLTRAVLSAALETDGANPRECEPAADGLSLVDSDDFERWLEASRVASLLDRQFNEQLSAIGSRLMGLRDSALPGTLTVPFEPKHFTGTLKDFAKELELGAISRGVLFDCAARLLGERLGAFYAELDLALDAMGAPAAMAGAKVAVPRPSPSRSGGNADRGGADAAAQATEAAATAGGDAADSGAIALDPQLLKSLIAREIKQREGLAQELMTFVTDVPDMTESLATWLGQLHAPLAREAAADHRFFQNRQHPLREIVDGLGHLQMFRANPDQDAADDPIYQRVSEILQPISRGETDEITLRSVAETLRRLTGDQSRLYQRNVERVVEASEGRDRVRRARQAVLIEIRRRYAGRQVPAVVPELLEVGWRSVLELASINTIDGDESYSEPLGLLDSLVSQLGGEAFEREPIEADPHRLLARIEKELLTVAFDPFRRNAVETRLRAEPAGDAPG